jgi:hypothetical protein
MYLSLWVGIDSYNLTCDINMSLRWYTINSYVEAIPRDIAKV